MSKVISKITHVKPQLYSQYYLVLKEIAKEHGYNLIVHGSMNRDMDLIAIPWVDNPKSEIDLVHAFDMYLNRYIAAPGHEKQIYRIGRLPGGRNVYTIDLYRGGYRKPLTDPPEFEPDPEYYLDISFTPLVHGD